MKFEVKSAILGFEDIKYVELNEVDDFFATLQSTQDSKISFTLVNPEHLRKYSFDVSTDTQESLDIKSSDDLAIYNIVVLQEPLKESKVNFLAPLVFNKRNKTVAQEVLGIQNYPHYGFDESINSFTNF